MQYSLLTGAFLFVYLGQSHNPMGGFLFEG